MQYRGVLHNALVLRALHMRCLHVRSYLLHVACNLRIHYIRTTFCPDVSAANNRVCFNALETNDTVNSTLTT